MEVIFKRIGEFLYTNTLWVFITLILFISYLLIIAGAPNTGGAYLSNVAGISLAFAPVLLFAGFREWLKNRTGRTAFAAIWICCMLIYPLFLAGVSGRWCSACFPMQELVLKIGPEQFWRNLGLSLTGTELALQVNDYFRDRIDGSGWFRRLSPEKGIIGVCVLLSLLLGFVFTQKIQPATGGIAVLPLLQQIGISLLNSLQIFFIFLAYYFFYYCNRYVLIPRFLKAKGIIHYGFSLAAVILICYPVLVGLIRLLPLVQQWKIGNYAALAGIFALDGGALPFAVLMISAPVIVSYQWYRQNEAIARLEKERSEGELNLLKQQINPHFFFNTLNNLYALSLTRDQSTPQVILQLSELMRYVIYRGSERTVPLADEVKYMEDYLQLQRIRLYRRLDLCFDRQVENEQLPVPPLLFVILVENAFKHGVEPACEQAFLHISLRSSGRLLEFHCANSFEEQTASRNGIGLDNLKRRLALDFPQKHQFSCTAEDGVFRANLKLDLS